MPESTGIWLADGEDVGSTPWEFTTIYNNGAATFALDAGAAQNGNYGYKFTSDASNMAYARKTFTATDEIYVRLYLKIPTGFNLGNGSLMYFMQFNAVLSDEARFGFGTDSSGVPNKWAGWFPYTNQYYEGDIALDTWHCIEVRYLKHASTGGWEMWINGTKRLTDLDQAQNVQVSSVYIGPSYTNDPVGSGDILYFDDIKADTSYIGAYADVSSGHPAMKRFGGVPHMAVNKGVW